MIQIRKATKKDLYALNDLMYRSKSYWGYEEDFMKKFMSIFSLTDDYLHKGHVFIAIHHARNIGFYSFSYNKDNQLELDYFFLSPDYIGQGMGKMLWRKCIGTAACYKEPYFVLWSDPRAEQFYIKMGCQKIGERQSLILPNTYSPILRYNL